MRGCASRPRYEGGGRNGTVEPPAQHPGAYRELFVDAGTAMLDRLVCVARAVVHEQVAELHPGRHASVPGQIRESIGN